jgi:hypothetical protein
VPLRSVEAASRDDAIAAAREQFGPQARVVGVRRVRSGGVLGFFATERYIAEVAELAADPVARPAVPSRTPADDAAPADFSSPLGSAAPARARAAAPARNGAAAWAAAAAARSADDIPPAARAAAEAARAARSAAPARAAAPARSAASATPAPAAAPTRAAAPVWNAPPAAGRADDDRVSELVGLLAAQKSQPATPSYNRATFPRASFPRTGAVARPGEDLRDDEDEIGASVPASPSSPSPFTAALARMVAGDQHVQQAVQEALAQPAETRPRDDAEPWPGRPEPVRTADSSVPPLAAGQEEETVGDQVIVPPSTTDRPVEVPPWAAQPEVTAASVSPREEAIADLLRGALAQGHSDEALAGILRKVLAGASPQTALTEPGTAAPAEPVFAVPAEPVFAVPAEPVFAEPVFAVPNVVPASHDVPAAASPVPTAPVLAAVAAPEPVDRAVAPELVVPVAGAPVVEPAVVAEPAPAVVEIAPTPAPVVPPTPEVQMWGSPSSPVQLWGETVPAVGARVTEDVASSWTQVALTEPVNSALFPTATVDEVVLAPPVVEAPVAEAPVVEAPVVEASVVEAPVVEAPVVETLAVEEPVAEIPAAEDSAGREIEAQAVEESVEEYVEEAEVAELAPMLARTASDPAPMMSLDATTVMPPLSLLPPLPGSRGRGRPPVPPAAPRAGASSSLRSSAPVPAAPATGPAEDAVGTDPVLTGPSSAESPAVEAPEPAAPSPAIRLLATVTRLPVAPLMADPSIPELPENLDEFDAEELPTTSTPAVLASSDVAGRLGLLGVPDELLGGTFAEDVAERGTYAALTRSLALQLPKAPALPRGAGEAVFVVGPGADALRAARSLAASLHLDPDCVQWATRGDLAGLAPRSSRVTSIDAAIDRRQESAAAGTVTIVAVDAPLRSDAYWMAQLMSVWTPAAVWAVVEATRKPEDLEPWIDGLPRVDALIVQDTDLSADPAAVLRRVNAPVALLDGAPATPHRWASLLCERLESTTT